MGEGAGFILSFHALAYCCTRDERIREGGRIHSLFPCTGVLVYEGSENRGRGGVQDDGHIYNVGLLWVV